jgi:hypothetical protein
LATISRRLVAWRALVVWIVVLEGVRRTGLVVVVVRVLRVLRLIVTK